MRSSLKSLVASVSLLLPLAGLSLPSHGQTQTAPSLPSPPAPPEEPLSLNQALQRAVSGNVDLQRERVTIQIADANLLTARGLFDFVLGVDLNFQRTTQPPLTAEDIASGYNNDLGFDLSLSRNLESGGSVRLGIQNDAITTNSRLQCGSVAGPSVSCTFYNSVLGLTFNHPLLRGFGTEFTMANIRRQRVQKDIALLNRQMRAANVLRDVINAYWELAYWTQDLAIRRSAVELAREQLRVTKAQIDVGRLAPIDQASVERAIGQRLQDVVSSEQNLYFRSLDLRRLLGLPSSPGQARFAAADMPAETARPVDVSGEMRRALEANPQLRASRMGQQLNAIDIQTAQSTLKPRLDFVGTVGSRGRNSNYPDTLSQTAGLDDLTWSAGLSFQAPIENRTANGQFRAAILGAEAARLDTTTLELVIRDTVMRLAFNINSASQRLELAKQTVGFAQQNLEAEKARFSVGRSTNNEVLRVQQDLKAAEIDVVRATVDLLTSESNLSAITAENLDRYSVTLRGL
jgi:outer membrane protein